MPRYFIGRYTADDELSHLIAELKKARKSAGYSQKEFGKLVGLSRETIVSIEGLMQCSILTLECELLRRWFKVCAIRISAAQRKQLENAMRAYLLPPFNVNNQQ